MKNKKKALRFFTILAVLLLCGWLAGCSSDGTVASTSTTDTTTPTDPTAPGDPAPAEASLNPVVLDAAASFLAAATGKEAPMNIDQVAFVNSVLWWDQMPVTETQAVAGGSSSQLQKCLFSDLFVLLRDEYGLPILDENGCEMPLASPPIEIPVLDEQGNPVLDEDGKPLVTISTTVPMVFEEYMNGEFKCSVPEEYAIYTIPVEIGRLNMVRSSIQNPDTVNRAFEEAMKNINNAERIESDLSGRLVLVATRTVMDELGRPQVETVRTAIDAPRENLALYRNLMTYGKLVGYGVEKIGEEGQKIPAPWLEIRPDLTMGDLAFLREGTAGRSYGVDFLAPGYPDLSPATHSTREDYSGKEVNYVQYLDGEDYLFGVGECRYRDERADAWLRVFGGSKYAPPKPPLANMEAFVGHADDARKMIVFLHNIIQDKPAPKSEPELPSATQVWNTDHLTRIPEMMGDSPLPQHHLLLEQAAAFLGAAAGKEIPLTIDATLFVNTVIGLNDPDLTETDKGALFGDLWVLLRDENGVPILDENGCVRPLPSEPITMTEYDEDGNPVEVPLETVPMMLEEYMDGQLKCTVVPGYEDFVMEVEIGRLNCVRNFLSNPGMLNKHLYEAVKNINSGVLVKRDLAGRLVYSTQVLDEEGQPKLDVDGNPVLKDHTIDSPMENIALYRALLKWGKLDGINLTLKVEGQETQVILTIEDTVDVYSHGMEFLKYGDETGQGLGRHPGSNYANFSTFSHNTKADFNGVPVDFVERVVDGVCDYRDVLGANLWTRVLRGNDDLNGNIKGFVTHADDVRKTILFTHNVITDPLPVE